MSGSEISARLAARSLSIHLVGIGGIGMSGLADLLRLNGHLLSGSDKQANRLTADLADKGVTIHQGHAADHVPPGCDLVVRSSAVGDDNPEVREARRRGVPVRLRGEVFAAFCEERRLVAVCGTHGKTTTSAMLAHVLEPSGAGWFVGGESAQLGAVARDARAGAAFVAECDESDGTLVHYRPEIAVVTNVEFDHMETFGGEEEFLDCFRTLLVRSGQVFFGADDPLARKLAWEVRGTADRERKMEGAGLEDGAFRAAGLRLEGDGSVFELPEIGRCSLRVPGSHNVKNAVLAARVALSLGMAPEVVRERLASFESVGRRFETVFDAGGIQVVSDYAHHPTEIRAVLEAAFGLKPRRVLAVYQPHRYSRTAALLQDFPTAFSGIDRLWLLPVYAASEQPVAGGTSDDLAAECARQNVDCGLELTVESAWAAVRAELREGDLFLILGAGDVVRMCELVDLQSGPF